MDTDKKLPMDKPNPSETSGWRKPLQYAREAFAAAIAVASLLPRAITIACDIGPAFLYNEIRHCLRNQHETKNESKALMERGEKAEEAFSHIAARGFYIYGRLAGHPQLALDFSATRQNEKYARLALEKGKADPNLSASHYRMFWWMRDSLDRPISSSLYNENTRILRLLLDHGADPNAAGNFSYLHLTSAIMYGKTEAAQVLLDHGADPLLLEARSGKSPRDHAAECQNPDFLEMIDAALASRTALALQKEKEKSETEYRAAFGQRLKKLETLAATRARKTNKNEGQAAP